MYSRLLNHNLQSLTYRYTKVHQLYGYNYYLEKNLWIFAYLKKWNIVLTLLYGQATHLPHLPCQSKVQQSVGGATSNRIQPITLMPYTALYLEVNVTFRTTAVPYRGTVALLSIVPLFIKFRSYNKEVLISQQNIHTQARLHIYSI